MKLIRPALLGLLLVLTGCSSTGAVTPSPSAYHYSDEWWYDDYLYYWHYYYPDCCHGDGEFKAMVTGWWNSLDPDKQQEIKDKIENWKGNHADIADNLPAMKAETDAKWQSLSPDQQQQIQQKLQSRREQGPIDRSAIRANRPAFQRGMMNHPGFQPGMFPRLGGGGLRGRL